MDRTRNWFGVTVHVHPAVEGTGSSPAGHARTCLAVIAKRRARAIT